MVQFNAHIYLLLIFVIYSFLIIALDQKKLLKKYNITAYGPIIMVRTQRGQGLLEYLARVKRFWKVYANIGLPMMVMCMAFMFLMLIFQAYIVVINYTRYQELPPHELTDPRAMLIIPGVNPMLPLDWAVWIIIGMVVAIIAHEFSHGILCKVEEVKVKSMGAIFALIPIGAFVEPDETQLFGPKEGKVENEVDETLDLKTIDSAQRSRILAAGVMSNFVVAAMAFVLFFGLITTSIAPVSDGVPIGGVIDGYPAKEAGIKEGMIITEIDGVPIKTAQDFINYTNKTEPGQTIEVKMSSGELFELKLSKPPHNFTHGFLGIYREPRGSTEFYDFLKTTPKSFIGWLTLIGLPFYYRFGGFDSMIAQFYTPVGFLSFMGNGVFWIANSLFWIAFINLLVAIFNSLPAIPLDGGHVFRELLNSFIGLIVKNEENRKRISNTLINSMALLILILILFPFVFSALVQVQ